MTALETVALYTATTTTQGVTFVVAFSDRRRRLALVREKVATMPAVVAAAHATEQERERLGEDVLSADEYRAAIRDARH